MTTIQIDPKWGVQLEGEAADVESLAKMLNDSAERPDDFFVWWWERVAILRTTRWDALQTDAEVDALAKEQIRILSGCSTLLRNSAPISTGTIYRFENGQIDLSRITNLKLRVTPAVPPTPHEFKHVLKLCDAHEPLANILSLKGQEVDWFTIYKMIEALESYFGTEAKMLKCAYLESSKLKRAKRMANSFRHLDQRKHRPPPKPMTLYEADALLVRSVMKVLGQLGLTYSHSAPASSAINPTSMD